MSAEQDDKGWRWCLWWWWWFRRRVRRCAQEGYRRILLQKRFLYRFFVWVWLPITLLGWFGLLFGWEGVMPWVQDALWKTEIVAKGLCVLIAATGVAL